jgi:hypothetical protein
MGRKSVLLFVLIFSILALSLYSQGTIFYLNFDQFTPGTYTDGTPYTIGSTEVSRPGVAGLGNATFVFKNNGGNGPTIGAPPGGLAGTPQGGNCLIVDSGAGQDEGLHIIVDNGLAKQDFTMEVLWFTNNLTGGTNTAGIQSPMGGEWPVGETSQFFIRTVNVGTTRMDYWTDRGDSNGEMVQVAAGGYALNTWHNDAIVFDYNPGTPASSTMYAYRDTVLINSSVYNATAASVSLFGTSYTGLRRMAVGIHNSMEAAPGDHRGLSGGVDAIAISLGILGPGTFVLPTGNVPVSDWTLY